MGDELPGWPRPPSEVPRRLRVDGHSLELTHPVLLYDGDTEKVKTDGQTDPGQVASRSPSCLRNPSEATVTRARPSETGLTEDSCPWSADPQRHHRARNGPEEPDSRTFRAGRVNGPVSPAPHGIPKGSSVPQHRGRERALFFSLSRIN